MHRRLALGPHVPQPVADPLDVVRQRAFGLHPSIVDLARQDATPRGASAARQLHPVSPLAQADRDLVAMVALDLHRAVLDRPARAAQALQIGGNPVEVARRKPVDDRHRLAAALALLPEDANDAVPRERRRLLLARTFPAPPPLVAVVG